MAPFNYVLVRAAKGMIDIFDLDPENSNILSVSSNELMVLGQVQDRLRYEPDTDTGGWDYFILVFNNYTGKLIRRVKIDKTSTPESFLAVLA